jgi:hypothetical protein
MIHKRAFWIRVRIRRTTVQAPTKYELVVNSKAAKTLGLTLPPSLLATADEVNY